MSNCLKLSSNSTIEIGLYQGGLKFIISFSRLNKGGGNLVCSFGNIADPCP